MVYQYNYIGDPAVKLPFPDGVEFNDDFSLEEKIYDFVYLGKLRGDDVFNLVVFPF